MRTETVENWTSIIKPKTKWFEFNLKEIWEYRDLIYIFVKRDIVSINKQTVLGPLWFFLGPLFTVVIYTLVFNKIADISTDNIPAPLFYLAGTTMWGYFQTCFLSTTTTFTANAALFGKVYFPRLVAPISIIISNLLKFFIQLLMFICFWIYYLKGASLKEPITPNIYLMLLPLLIIMMGGIALGAGIIISSLTTKYRDLSYFVSFGITLLMYITPVIYPVSAIPEDFRFLIQYNPISPIIETFRYGFTGFGNHDINSLLYSFISMVILLLVGIVLFNKTEKNFMDTV